MLAPSKTFLILAAQKEELDGFFPGEEGPLREGRIGSRRVVGAISGIGKVAMADEASLLLEKVHPDLVINIGVAGSISKKLSVLETLVATKAAYWDVDLTPFGHPVGEMSGCPLYFASDARANNLLKDKDREGIKFGLILSGDSFVTVQNRKPEWAKNFEDPLAVDMESAALAQVAYRHKVPFVIIRSISDNTEAKGNSSVYEKNLIPMAEKAAALAKELILGY